MSCFYYYQRTEGYPLRYEGKEINANSFLSFGDLA